MREFWRPKKALALLSLAQGTASPRPILVAARHLLGAPPDARGMGSGAAEGTGAAAGGGQCTQAELDAAVARAVTAALQTAETEKQTALAAAEAEKAAALQAAATEKAAALQAAEDEKAQEICAASWYVEHCGL